MGLFSKIGKAISKAAGQATKAVSKAAKQATNVAKKAAKQATKAAKKAAKQTTKVAKKAAKQAKQAAKKALAGPAGQVLTAWNPALGIVAKSVVSKTPAKTLLSKGQTFLGNIAGGFASFFGAPPQVQVAAQKVSLAVPKLFTPAGRTSLASEVLAEGGEYAMGFFDDLSGLARQAGSSLLSTGTDYLSGVLGVGDSEGERLPAPIPRTPSPTVSTPPIWGPGDTIDVGVRIGQGLRKIYEGMKTPAPVGQTVPVPPRVTESWHPDYVGPPAITGGAPMNGVALSEGGATMIAYTRKVGRFIVAYNWQGEPIGWKPAPRHMNPLNMKALTRSQRRIDGFEKIIRRSFRITSGKRMERRGLFRRKRSGRKTCRR
jgi:hypothetical protein